MAGSSAQECSRVPTHTLLSVYGGGGARVRCPAQVCKVFSSGDDPGDLSSWLSFAVAATQTGSPAMMESATAVVRDAPGTQLARARAALVYPGGERRRIVGRGAGHLAAAPGRRRRALVVIASLHEPLPSHAPQEDLVAVAPQAD
ncbi:unnamed protein product [Urochloa humidicola]